MKEGEGRDRVIIFRLSEEEDRQIDEAVEKTDHKNKSKWMRDTLLEAAKGSEMKNPESRPAVLEDSFLD